MDASWKYMAKSCACAAGVYQSNNDAQQNEEQEDAGIALDGRHETMVYNSVQCGDRGKVADEKAAYHDAQKEGSVSLLGDQPNNLKY